MRHLLPHNLIKEIKKGIPGEKSHVRMAPLSRPLTSYALKTVSDVRESAVAVILYPTEWEVECILIQRPEYNGTHSGQIAFPGGKKDPDDLDLEYTARREAFEEVGVPETEGLLIGELTHVYIPVSGFLVKPFLFYHEELPPLTPDPREVAEIFSFSLSELMNESSFSTMTIKFPTGFVQKDIPCFLLNGKEIWGATALILNELRDLLLRM